MVAERAKGGGDVGRTIGRLLGGQPDRPQTPPLGPRLKASLRRQGSGLEPDHLTDTGAGAFIGDMEDKLRRTPGSSWSSSPVMVPIVVVVLTGSVRPRTIGGQPSAVLVGAQVRCASAKAIVDVGQDRAGIDRRTAVRQSQILRRDRRRRVARNVHGGNADLVGDPDAVRLLAGAGAEAIEAGVGRAVENEGPGGVTPVEAVVVEVG